jgi:hypothetical protein
MPKQVEQNRAWPLELVQMHLIADLARCLDLLELARRNLDLAALLQANASPDKPAASVLKVASVQHLVDRGVDRLAKALKQLAKPDIVEPALADQG